MIAPPQPSAATEIDQDGAEAYFAGRDFARIAIGSFFLFLLVLFVLHGRRAVLWAMLAQARGRKVPTPPPRDRTVVKASLVALLLAVLAPVGAFARMLYVIYAD
jgi:hypothetical protein